MEIEIWQQENTYRGEFLEKTQAFFQEKYQECEDV